MTMDPSRDQWAWPKTERPDAPLPELDEEQRRKARNAAVRDRRLRKLRRAQVLARRWEADDEDVTIRDILDALLRPSPPLSNRRPRK